MEQQQVTSAAPAATSYGVHTPERHPDETQYDYRMRREWSRREVRRMTGHGLGGGISSREQYRDSMRKSGTMGKRIRAADALVAAWASKRIPKWKGPSDKHGAYTLTGRSYFPDGTQRRRVWLAGISAQRGY